MRGPERAPTIEATDAVPDDLYCRSHGDVIQARSTALRVRIVFATGNGEVANWPDAMVLRRPCELQGLVQVLARQPVTAWTAGALLQPASAGDYSCAAPAGLSWASHTS